MAGQFFISKPAVSKADRPAFDFAATISYQE
jgi:hypothetical protein